MKIMVISDIHGNYECLEKVLNIYDQESYDTLFVLGDIYSFYNTYEDELINNRLNYIKNKYIVKGNCDNIDNIPDIINITINNTNYTLTHGHKYNKDYLLNLNNDIILNGHTHIAKIEVINNKIIINPGSISKPREGEKSFCEIYDNTIYIKSIDNVIINKKSIY